MATDVLVTPQVEHSSPANPSAWNLMKRVLEPAASLKLTVVLFALSIFLILAGTFAQVDMDIWEVISQYFRIWFAWIPFQVFFPTTFSPDAPITVPGGIWFPGGKLLGLLLAINLVSAHLVRFKVHARGGRLLAGLAAIGTGCFLTWIIIRAGGNSKGMLAEPSIPYRTQWIGFQGFIGLCIMSMTYFAVTLSRSSLASNPEKRRRQRFLQVGLVTFSAILGGVLIWIMSRGAAGRPSDSSLRILWQLAQGTFASLALLGGCWIVFQKRAGVVLLHAGIGLMMFYELHVALTAIETQMNLAEGERTNFVHDIRTFELAFINGTDPTHEHVVAVPKAVLLQGIEKPTPKTIETAELPFKFQFHGYQKNSVIRAAQRNEKNLATTGLGLRWIPEERTASAGTDNDSRVDQPAAYLTILSKSDNTPIGTYLVSYLLAMNDKTDRFDVEGKSYRVELRPKRYYKPFQFELKDVRKEDYLGTSTPRFYASTVHITDPTRNVDDEKTIWMNNPLRFADETFYQSGFHRQDGTGIESTTLSVVANSGWMMPYVGCMLVGIGMLVHFLTLLVQFLNKGDAPDISPADAERAEQLAAKLGIPIAKPKETARPATQKPAWGATSFMAITMLIGAGYLISVLIPPKAQTFQFDLYRFGQIPVVSEGRTKPIDSAASTALLAISGRSTLKIEAEEADKSSDQDPSNEKTKASKKSEILPATAWFLETVTDKRESDDRHVFRIENLEVQETVGVKKREGMRYSRNEIVNRGDEFRKQFEDARKQVESGAKPSVFQKKVLELSDKFATYGNLKVAFGLQNTIGGETREAVMKSFERAIQVSEGLEDRGSPIFAIAPTSEDEKWHTFSRAWILDLINRIQKKGDENKTVAAWDQILKAYSQNKPEEFNKAVDQLLSMIDANPPKDVKPWVIRLEAYLNYVQPFTKAAVLYMFAFVLGAVGWLAWPRGFNKAAFGLMLVVFVLHTAALVARLIISGRPPVTNLYSSAVFIGWGCVLLGLMFEVVYRIGIGNLVAAVAGFATLLIADGLSNDGDTFTVLQAVLDTQFWLATHVTCITLGYATTYLAGLFGVAYIVRGVCTPSLTREDGQNIYRMIYGTLCFSIFFSFVGTVLGGLWADDSWGRFWGWDPKENAALIIVLWNALALHARWGGMVRERGLASLAVAGNIFVSWSWWGVNALGAGLHSYGFKQGTLRILGEFILANLLIIAIASIPKKHWWSVRRQLARPTGN